MMHANIFNLEHGDVSYLEIGTDIDLGPYGMAKIVPMKTKIYSRGTCSALPSFNLTCTS